MRLPRAIGILALGLVLAAILIFCVIGLRVAPVQGAIGIVDDIHASQESWRVGPAANVDVLVLWRVRDLRYPRSLCARAVVTRTNAQGEYFVDSWWLSPSWPLQFDALAEVYVFKPGFTPLVDRSRLGQYRNYSEILGPPAVNPWTGLVMPDEDQVKVMRDRFCPALERL